MSGRLQNQVAWITGAASGMGEGIARLFAAEGAAVALVDVQSAKGYAVAEKIRAEGGRAIFIECDVAKEAAVRASIERAEKEFGGLQIIANCAGIVQIKLLHELEEADWDRLMDINVKSIFFSIKHGIRFLKRNPRSYVVNIGSVGSFIGQSSTPAYSTSKGAVMMLSKSIALDYAAAGVRCNCVCPGITDTPMLREHLRMHPDPDTALRERLRRVPIGVALTPDDIAKAVLYFSCEDSAGVTGTTLVVDGGYLTAAEWRHPGHTKFMDPL
ncbi:MAG TPA: SDR family NAD(P)-dependent oxidoreductase [Verrucomicrobiae bacterium]|jgi:NAD(P)-dependent dehydrogenase (short-subunit alcohol dehydrogenase family)